MRARAPIAVKLAVVLLREATSSFLNDQPPWRVVPELMAFGKEAVDLPSIEIEQSPARPLRFRRRDLGYGREAQTG